LSEEAWGSKWLEPREDLGWRALVEDRARTISDARVASKCDVSYGEEREERERRGPLNVRSFG
jgi:hypothetical protein